MSEPVSRFIEVNESREKVVGYLQSASICVRNAKHIRRGLHERHGSTQVRHESTRRTRTDTNRHEPTRTTRAIRRDTNQHEPTRTTRMTRMTRVDMYMCRVSAVYINHCQRSSLARGQGHHIAQSPQDSPLLLGMENLLSHNYPC